MLQSLPSVSLVTMFSSDQHTFLHELCLSYPFSDIVFISLSSFRDECLV